MPASTGSSSSARRAGAGIVDDCSTPTTRASSQGTLDTTGLADGAYTCASRVTRRRGQRRRQPDVTVDASTTRLPTGSLTAPTAGALLRGTTNGSRRPRATPARDAVRDLRAVSERRRHVDGDLDRHHVSVHGRLGYDRARRLVRPARRRHRRGRQRLHERRRDGERRQHRADRLRHGADRRRRSCAARVNGAHRERVATTAARARPSVAFERSQRRRLGDRSRPTTPRRTRRNWDTHRPQRQLTTCARRHRRDRQRSRARPSR